MARMTTHERVSRMFEHREADCVPITDWVWESTYQRWRDEGLPADADLFDYLDLDRIIWLSNDVVDTSPRFEKLVIEETDTYRIERNEWGVTLKNFKPVSTTPQDLDFLIKDPDSWREAKERMAPTRDRVNWSLLRQHYRKWREQGAWIALAPWFGFDIVNTRMCGTERTMLALAQEPEWCVDMFNTQLDLAIALMGMMWDEGYTFDELLWFDDMAYRNGMFFSPRMYRELVKPYQQRAVDWAHARGIKAHLHCCGNIAGLIAELIDMGVDALHPLEVKAGMDPVALKSAYGDKLVLHGGFDVRHWSDIEEVEAEIRSVLPAVMESGGYIFSSDHSVPDSVSLENYRRIVQLVREVGRY
ncbi:MAG: uroporphyrinogen decarboxylase family protein [Anaerolineae bacterium]|nr:uroporphyrinogen decarboxylase family protein [Anaerolineae bacterium]